MGYKYDDHFILCPLFQNSIRTRKGQFIGIECIQSEQNLGFDISHVLRFRTREEQKDYMGIFCRDMYKTCPYYIEYCRESGVET